MAQARDGSMLARALLEIQHRYGYLPQVELEFLAIRTGLPLYRIQEVSTYFPHFRRTEPPEVSVQVCQSMTCHLRGSAQMLDKAKLLAAESDRVEVQGVSCLGRCDRAPVALISRHAPIGAIFHGSNFHDHLYTELGGGKNSLPELIEKTLLGQAPPPDRDLQGDSPHWEINVYDRREGTNVEPYAAIKRMLREELSGPQVIKHLEEADLIGMGGAAARTAKKWQDVTNASGEKRYIICNADESEPGTFKDREILLHAPHLIVEGMLVAALTLGAPKRETRGYIYIRHEYFEQIQRVNAAIQQARQQVPEALEACPIEVFVSPGLYICGEESALIEVIEGKRAQPRNQPPDIRNNGLFDQPTLVNNVETFAWVPAILLSSHGEKETSKPAGWYGSEPRRFFSISGDVKRPGVYEVPFRTTLGDLIHKLAGGLRDGVDRIHAIAPSGPSGGFLPATLDAAWARGMLDEGIEGLRRRSAPQAARVVAFRKSITGERLSILDMPLDVPVFRTLELSLGAGIVVYGAANGTGPPDMIDHALNCLEFFENESCGKCVPCRLGCQQLTHFASEIKEQGAQQKRSLPLVEVDGVVRQLAEAMEITSICGLGRGAATPLITWLDHFSK